MDTRSTKRQSAKAWLLGHSPEALSAEIRQIREGLFHMGPLAFTFRDHVYSSGKAWGNNLAQSDGRDLLNEAADSPINSLDDGLAEIIACLVLLRRAGGQFRLEEANGSILSFQCVASLFRDLESTYRLAKGPSSLDASDLQAIELLHQRSITLASAHSTLAQRTYRFIDGATLRRSTRLMPHSLHQNPRGFHLAAGFRLTSTEIAALARRACLALNSDFALIRGPRNPRLPEDMTAVTKNDFFCCVSVSAEFAPHTHHLEGSVAAMQWAQASRMSFNCWKFWHGNLNETERRPGQYYWVPSSMPDIATNESSLHKGHAKAAVAHTIRWPFDLTLGNRFQRRSFSSIADVRWCRGPCSPPFEEDDLIVCATLVKEAHAMLQAWANSARLVEQEIIEGFRQVDYFDEGNRTC